MGQGKTRPEAPAHTSQAWAEAQEPRGQELVTRRGPGLARQGGSGGTWTSVAGVQLLVT